MAMCKVIDRLCCHDWPDSWGLRFPLESVHWLANRDYLSEQAVNLVQNLASLCCNLCIGKTGLKSNLLRTMKAETRLFTHRKGFYTKHAKLRTRKN